MSTNNPENPYEVTPYWGDGRDPNQMIRQQLVENRARVAVFVGLVVSAAVPLVIYWDQIVGAVKQNLGN